MPASQPIRCAVSCSEPRVASSDLLVDLGSPLFLALAAAYVVVFIVAARQLFSLVRLWMCQQHHMASIELTLVMLCAMARAINMFLYYFLRSSQLSLAVAAFISGFPLILNGYIFCLIVLAWCAVRIGCALVLIVLPRPTQGWSGARCARQDDSLAVAAARAACCGHGPIDHRRRHSSALRLDHLAA